MKMPSDIKPMAFKAGKQPFNDKEWCFEIKEDGFRILAYINEGQVKLQTRKLKDYSARFPLIVTALQKWKHNAIIDGEVVALNEQGDADFDALLNWKKDKNIPVRYHVFDLLWLDGISYLQEPLMARKQALQKILRISPVVQYQDHVVAQGMKVFEMAKREGLEGIVAKKMDSTYRPGKRTNLWLKLKVLQDREFIITGYTRNQEAGTSFGTLILAAYHQGKLQFAGEVGTGFTEKLKQEIVRQLHPVKKCPFPVEPHLTSRWRKKKPEQIIWCRQEVVCTVKYLEQTKEGQLRHPVFKCLQPDVKPTEVTI